MANQMCNTITIHCSFTETSGNTEKIQRNCNTMAATSASSNKDIKVFRKKNIKEEKKLEIGKAIKVKP